ncbi:BA14K family protein [Bradyrhizobium sp. AUGA SZCCT0240]|uniref:BA14K family protein n=1 Tax=unclassified Bradyrhizobium TaxID=2631580 RepID=UPI001BACE129|nr:MULTISPECIES: BA14K family protein [unclassified Bradyrhizobium]MBR1191067.1 BA14K family protein [Bradyrhizobium sp. AUGA SZCCT0160]MBR1197012.1 BA14K family protein [Bradyrhizobium sp. AUGA SZCCT0158]MBR1242068.1 BA14K family protein [Bradyrhizobium sp. AUGA SZCCT0274]MBR1248219.1 BA14K family protein [Bradyrhizobium sp. AUGA SZCCT0169]MBR1253922.1 BA14K family protein [Bradyrhizobium sp. AUGA SZCCT0240]
MVSKLAVTTLLALAICAPVQQAVAQDAIGGAIVGGVLGGVVGGALGGRGGAAAGAIIGAGTGAAIASQGEPRPGGYRYYNNGCYVEQPGGWVAVSPRYCGMEAQYVAPPPQQYYDDTPRCMRSRSYDPRRGTFIGRDGYERPCP